MTGKILKFAFILAFTPVVGFALWLGEVWLWNILPVTLRWISIWIQVAIMGVGLGLLVFFKVVTPLVQRARERQREALILQEQATYDGRKGNPCIYVNASGTISRIIWNNLRQFIDEIREQRIKFFLLVPDEDMDNARMQVESVLGPLASVEPSPVKLEPVTAGNVTEGAAAKVREVERKDVSAHFYEWAKEALSGVRMTVQLVGIPGGGQVSDKSGNGGDGTGFTSKTSFEHYPFLGLRRDIAGAGGGIGGDVCRWIFFVRDMMVSEPAPEETDFHPTFDANNQGILDDMNPDNVSEEDEDIGDIDDDTDDPTEHEKYKHEEVNHD